MQAIADKMRKAGYTPSHIPLGIDLREGGRCIRCKTCDGFPCLVAAKADTDITCVRPAVATGAVELLTNGYVERVLTDPTGSHATGVKIIRDDPTLDVQAERRRVLRGGQLRGAVAASATDRHPDGLANSSGQWAGTTWCTTTPSWSASAPSIETLDHSRRPVLQRLLSPKAPRPPVPTGSRSTHRQASGCHVKGNRPEIPVWALDMAANRSIDWWLFTEDLPDPDNRVTPCTTATSRSLDTEQRPGSRSLDPRDPQLLKKVGYPFVFSRRTGIEVNSHQAGTVRAGVDPATSVLDPDCRAHDVDNLSSWIQRSSPRYR